MHQRTEAHNSVIAQRLSKPSQWKTTVHNGIKIELSHLTQKNARKVVKELTPDTIPKKKRCQNGLASNECGYDKSLKKS